MSNNPLIKAIYDYQATDLKILSCNAGERFIIIKLVDPRSDWLYVVNCHGKLGYIPANYTEPDTLDDRKFLELIDNVISVLDADHNDPQIITIRQINHAQVKLTQLRCEVANRLYANSTTPSPDLAAAASNLSLIRDPERINQQQKQQQQPEAGDNEVTANNNNRGEIKSYQDVGIQVSLETPSSSSNTVPDRLAITIDDSMAAELVERVRVSTELSHGMCKLTIETVINFLREKIPLLEDGMANLLAKLESVDQCPSPLVMKNSSDLVRLRSLFNKLWQCKNDEQQRSWPIHDDEEMESSLIELVKLLANANPTISREAMFSDNCENVYMIISYFHEETKKSLKMQVYSVLMEIIRLNENMIEDNFLSTVLPQSLANEMMNHKEDVERWSKASILFTYVFGSGQKPPINIYEHVNEKFVNHQLDLIEGEDLEGEKVPEHKIPPEMSIPPILAFNLHFDSSENNLVLKALKMRKNVKHLMENLVSYLNWEEDPTLLINYFGRPMKTCERPNAVHKLLIEIFEDPQLAAILYFNDVKVMIDILISHLNNLQGGDVNRHSYLNLLFNIIKNTSYMEEPHKLEEVQKCIGDIYSHEASTENEKQIVQRIKEILNPSE